MVSDRLSAIRRPWRRSEAHLKQDRRLKPAVHKRVTVTPAVYPRLVCVCVVLPMCTLGVCLVVYLSIWKI